MKIGIYISGLGQSVVNETVDKYAERLMNEMRFSTKNTDYELKRESIAYANGKNSSVVTICNKDNPSEILYKLYEYNYHDSLTERFNSYSLIRKNFWLLVLVIQRFPQVLKQAVLRSKFTHPFQTFYIFTIFLILAAFMILMIPATLEVINDFVKGDTVKGLEENIKNYFNLKEIPFLSRDCIEGGAKAVVLINTLLILLIPNANVLISNLASEFICANDYLQHGAQRQLIQGNLELLVEYITENEPECSIHFHTYSFGSIVAIDYLFPFGNTLSQNTEQYCKALITVGTPYEFIDCYYPNFYRNRNKEMENKLTWLNIYSVADALATNFRADGLAADPEYGIRDTSIKPINLNYEVSSPGRTGIVDFIMLYSVRVHGMYWDPKPQGQNCVKLIYKEMTKQQLIN